MRSAKTKSKPKYEITETKRQALKEITALYTIAWLHGGMKGCHVLKPVRKPSLMETMQYVADADYTRLEFLDSYNAAWRKKALAGMMQNIEKAIFDYLNQVDEREHPAAKPLNRSKKKRERTRAAEVCTDACTD